VSSTVCGICTGDQDRRVAVDRLLAAGKAPYRIERELTGLYPVSDRLVSSHREHWIGVLPTGDRDVMERIRRAQPVPVDLASIVRDDVRDRLLDGELRPTVAHGLKAQQMIDHREERQQDRELALGLAAMLAGGQGAVPKHIIDGDYEHLPVAAGDLRALRGRVATPVPAAKFDTAKQAHAAKGAE
jgi:hypothetical protein